MATTQVIGAAALFAAGAILLSLFMAFDRIVELEHAEHRGAWEADGRPHGFWFRLEETAGLRSSIALNVLFFMWLFVTPEWAQDSQEALSLFRRLRIHFTAWILACVLLMPVGIRLTSGT